MEKQSDHMAENSQTKPWAPVEVETGRTQDSAELQAKELRRRKRIKCCKFIVILLVVEAIILGILGGTILKIRSPRIRITSIMIQSGGNIVATPTPSFTLTLTAQLAIKNRNMGQYKYDNATLSISYHGTEVGAAQIPKGKAKLKATRRMNITIDVNSDKLVNHPSLGNDLSSGTLTLNAYTRIRGKVSLLYMMKKKRSGQMNCTIAIKTADKTIEKITC